MGTRLHILLFALFGWLLSDSIERGTHLRGRTLGAEWSG